MLFWPKDEFEQFIESVKGKPQSYISYTTLYYTGMRIGELSALTPADIDLEKSTININKSYQRLDGKASGVKVIRVHDTRHSHASLLIEMGFSPLLISDRLGHEKVETTLNTYSHLYQVSRQK